MAKVVIEGAEEVDGIYEAVDMSLCIVYVTIRCLLWSVRHGVINEGSVPL
jgi:hypothetical protein